MSSVFRKIQRQKNKSKRERTRPVKHNPGNDIKAIAEAKGSNYMEVLRQNGFVKGREELENIPDRRWLSQYVGLNN